MTAQAMEIIYIDGVKHHMASLPFGQYLDDLNNTPKFRWQSTACWRGYTGTWKIKDDKLFLIGLDGYIRTIDKRNQKFDISYFFPEQNEVFAEWFTGEIRIPIGELLQYIHMGYASVYEKDLLIQIEDGMVINKREIDNTLVLEPD